MLPGHASKEGAFTHFRSLQFAFLRSQEGELSNPFPSGRLIEDPMERHFGGEICCWSSLQFFLQSSSSFSVPECPVS